MQKLFIVLFLCISLLQLAFANPVFERAKQSSLEKRQTIPDNAKKCTVDFDCNNGHCASYNTTVSYCVCNTNYLSVNGGVCNYAQTSKTEAFLVSFFVGELGVDWFILAKGNSGYIVAGVFKLLTFGMLGIWWLVDWIRILAGSFYDGNGYPIGTWG